MTFSGIVQCYLGGCIVLDSLDLRGRDVEPFVDRWFNGRWRGTAITRKPEVVGVVSSNAASVKSVRYIGDRNTEIFCHAFVPEIGVWSAQTTPGFVALVDDFSRILLVLCFTREGKCVFGLAIGDLVDPEPLIRGPDEPWEVTFNIFNVIELGCEGIIDIDNNDFPISLAFIEQCHDSEDLDLLDLAGKADLLADLADIKRIIVALCLGLNVYLARVLPRLGERAVVPDVAVVGEAVAHKAQPALLDVLLDGVHELVFGDLHLRVRPAGDLDDHVEDAIVLISEEWDVVERRHDTAVVLHINSVFKRVLRSNQTRGELHGRGCGERTSSGEMACGACESSNRHHG